MKKNENKILVLVLVSYPNLWGFECGYETHTQNPNPYFFACECMRQTHDLFLVGLRFLLVFIVWKEIRLDGKKINFEYDHKINLFQLQILSKNLIFLL